MNINPSIRSGRSVNRFYRGLQRRRFRWSPGRMGAVAEYDDPPLFPWLGDPLSSFLVEKTVADPESVNRYGSEVQDFMQKHLVGGAGRTHLIWSVKRDRVEALPPGHSAIGVLQKVNNSRWINKYFRALNSRLEQGGVFIGCAEINGQRRRRIFARFPAPIASAYCGADFLIHRLWPKIPFLKKAYFALTRGHNRPMSQTEVLGRLVSCGFEIIEYKNIGRLMYFAVRKACEADVVHAPTYGPFCKLRRVGYGGNTFAVYKFRTMHPYAEFLQNYVYERNSLRDGGKFKDDFRITCWGRWLRRMWLDEIPMIINLIQGQMKLVGVRPLSVHYFGLYPEELRKLRARHLPGLLPPFYVDLPKTFDEIVASELKYLRAYEKAPLRTDIRYLFTALWNILVRRARSA